MLIYVTIPWWLIAALYLCVACGHMVSDILGPVFRHAKGAAVVGTAMLIVVFGLLWLPLWLFRAGMQAAMEYEHGG